MRRLTGICVILLAAGCETGPSKEQTPHVMEPHEGDHLWMFPESEDEVGTGGELQIYVAAHSHPGATASFAKFTLGVGGALPVHRHDETEEFAYFLSGQGVAVFVDEDGARTEVRVAPGYVWYNPAGFWHAVRNTGDEPLSLVFAIVPNEEQGLLSFFRQIGTTPGHAGTPIAPEELKRIGAEHDMILWEEGE